MNYGNANINNQEQQDFNYLDLLTILSVTLQLSDHEAAINQNTQIQEIQKQLREINSKLDYIIGRLGYGTSKELNS